MEKANYKNETIEGKFFKIMQKNLFLKIKNSISELGK